MTHKRFLSSLRYIAISFAVIGLMGAASEASAQKGATVRGNAPLTSQFGPSKFPRMDFSGDQRADIAIVNSAAAKWTIYAGDNIATEVEFGASADKPVPADYDGDKMEDVAVLQSSGGLLNWHILQSSNGATVDVSWGVDGDVAVQGDYDGDGKVDPAVWRASEALWHILASSTGSEIILDCGIASDKPMPGDYDGDGIMDAAVYRSVEHSFYFLASTTQTMNEQAFGPFAMSRFETFVSADFDGDGRTDFAMFNPKSLIWTILDSSTLEYRLVAIQGNHKPCNGSEATPCLVTDFALPADYDNDGKVDPAVWSSIDGFVYAVGSTDGAMKFATGNSDGMAAASSFFMTK